MICAKKNPFIPIRNPAINQIFKPIIIKDWNSVKRAVGFTFLKDLNQFQIILGSRLTNNRIDISRNSYW